jgi:hypothetical protein
MVDCRARRTANVYRSTLVCEAAEQRCEDALEVEQRMRLPSTGRFLCAAPPSLTVTVLAHAHVEGYAVTVLPGSSTSCDAAHALRLQGTLSAV